jgi:asparagine synthase (glutamine-hydrolysing)
MSVIFGLHRSLGEVVVGEELLQLAKATQRWALEGTSVLARGDVGMGLQPYFTHDRMRIEALPFEDAFGNVVAVDGRLDNYQELRGLLCLPNRPLPDSQIVLAAFQKWKEACFSYLVGDWAIAVWSAKAKKLYLARDHAGSRSLYYQRSGSAVVWSSYLETLVGGNNPHRLDRLFVNRYLTLQPLEDATPYEGIQAVPAGQYLTIDRDRLHGRPHWTPAESGNLTLSDEGEYEEQFLQLFRRSVERRIDGGVGVLAQLSGGIDSTSIVCMADEIRKSKDPGSELVDTLSFYDESESSWDEHKYFPVVEKFRGKTGHHIRTDGSRLSLTAPAPDYLFPGASGHSAQDEADFNCAIGIDKYRVILSGLGGDEFLGGVPYPYPELAHYLLRGRLLDLAKSGFSWGLALRSPLIELLTDTVAFIGDMVTERDLPNKVNLPWIAPSGVALLSEMSRRTLPRSYSPWRAYYTRLLVSARESLPHLRPQSSLRLEFRYPMLDRDLLDFLVRIPRNQLVRPGERRSLMRRALRNLVPVEILDRRRKAVVSQGPLRAVIGHHDQIASLFKDSLLESLGFVEGKALISSLTEVTDGKDISFYPGIRRAIEMELWLKARASRGRLAA